MMAQTAFSTRISRRPRETDLTILARDLVSKLSDLAENLGSHKHMNPRQVNIDFNRNPVYAGGATLLALLACLANGGQRTEAQTSRHPFAVRARKRPASRGTCAIFPVAGC
jgi:hypothetical protein